MRFWVREIAGWILVCIGLYLFLICLSMLTEPAPFSRYFLEAAPITIMGIVVFRGGIHLLKVAMAARICLHASEASADKGQQKKPV